MNYLHVFVNPKKGKITYFQFTYAYMFAFTASKQYFILTAEFPNDMLIDLFFCKIAKRTKFYHYMYVVDKVWFPLDVDLMLCTFAV